MCLVIKSTIGEEIEVVETKEIVSALKELAVKSKGEFSVDGGPDLSALSLTKDYYYIKGGFPKNRMTEEIKDVTKIMAAKGISLPAKFLYYEEAQNKGLDMSPGATVFFYRMALSIRDRLEQQNK